MIGALFALGICYWFYRSAEALRLSPLPWIMGGALVFYVSNYLWIYAVLKPLAGERIKNHGFTGGFVIELTGAVVGLAAAALLRNKVLLKQQSPE